MKVCFAVPTAVGAGEDCAKITGHVDELDEGNDSDGTGGKDFAESIRDTKIITKPGALMLGWCNRC
jgi:hypothetical protein